MHDMKILLAIGLDDRCHSKYVVKTNQPKLLP